MKKVFIQTYGCQMNEYDTELVKSILKQSNYTFTNEMNEADVVLINTCAIRENAHERVYGQLGHIKHLKSTKENLVVGVLGCMAQNLRESLVKESDVIDIAAGPDSYKRLPALLDNVMTTGMKGWDFNLSEFETYSDVYPERKAGINSWIAVMRGCDNFCTFCVVPYTRGRERSRSPESVVEETQRLVEQGYRQVSLLGQNVNSYKYENYDFADLMQKVGDVEGIERVRFTSPHPKDFPEKLLHVIAKHPNLCNHIHLPLQSGNNRVLEMMDRTYTTQEFLDLADNIRAIIPDVVLTTDVIVGFCTETEEEFEDTYCVMEQVEFDSAFIFKYSERKNTIAYRKFEDDVPEEIKSARISKLIALQKEISLKKNQVDIGKTFRVLVEGTSKRSDRDLMGRTDGNKIIVFPDDKTKPGEFTHVKIYHASSNTLIGKKSQITNDKIQTFS